MCQFHYKNIWINTNAVNLFIRTHKVLITALIEHMIGVKFYTQIEQSALLLPQGPTAVLGILFMMQL